MMRDFMKIIMSTFFILFFTLPFHLNVVDFSVETFRPAMAADINNYVSVPPFIASGAPPLVMLVMGKNHKLFYEAYNDASDIDGDGSLDVGYDPGIEYYGYFDSYKEYEYTSDGRFEPVADTSDKTVSSSSSSSRWSGDYLNYLTMTRMDCIRKVLYGGKRSTDETDLTVLERSHVPQDAHSWGKEYTSIAHDGYDIAHYTPFNEPTAGKHLFANTTREGESDPKLFVGLNSDKRIWEWVAKEKMVVDNTVTSDRTYKVYVKVGDSDVGDGPNQERFKKYDNATPDDTSDDIYKPIGILQRFGEDMGMYFGLISGSYTNNMSGGVLRKNISPITDEINLTTGQFTDVKGIIHTIDTFQIIDFSGDDYSGGWETNDPMPDSDEDFPDWGNPLAEMLYEALKYYGGESETSSFTSGILDGDDDGVDIPFKTWQDPYVDNFDYCAKPFILAISDIYPTYDSDQLPGVDSDFGNQSSETIGSASSSLNSSSIADTIFNEELSSGKFFIGAVGSNEDSSCSAKTVDSFGNIRGLCPEEPTKQGSYYSAAVTYYGKKEDLRDVEPTGKSFDHSVTSKMIGLASPLPEINIEVGDNSIRLLPFGKTVEADGDLKQEGEFAPTCTIVDFFVDTITATSGKFRINFEDVEQGADHDMDAVVIYEFQVVDFDGDPVTDPANGEKVEITLTSDYSGAGYIMHLGYIISGTTEDGTYLEVKDVGSNDVEYFMDTPPEGETYVSEGPVTRTFEPSAFSSGASMLKNPLWYAAKWGDFDDDNGNDMPDLQTEWDKDGDGSPDGYFYVQNPLDLEKQLNRSFLSIKSQSSAGSAASVVSETRSGSGAVYQAVFWPGDAEYTWRGDVRGILVDSEGHMYEDDGVEEDHLDLDPPDPADPNTQITSFVGEDITYLWRASDWLNDCDPDERDIFTFIDSDENMVCEGETADFKKSNASLIKPYLNSATTNAADEIDYIRGKKSEDVNSDFRDRKALKDDGLTEVWPWRLGDIVHSSPTIVSRPAENFHLLYHDGSYRNFLEDNQNRRQVVYVGANDGMLHAFNAGHFDGSGFAADPPGYSGTSHELGEELWAYIPYNLLPHLHWLTRESFDKEDKHVYYVDLQPMVFDAKIKGTAEDPEWGTFLVGGMRLGGGEIIADFDGDGNEETNGEDRIMTSAYFILDITDPLNPEVIAELSFDNLGYTTCFPAVIPMKNKNATTGAIENNDWYLVFGSGPASSTGRAGPDALKFAKSQQSANLYVVDLKSLVMSGTLLTLNSSGAFTTANTAYQSLDSDSFISEPISVDYDLDFSVDAVYFGTVSGSESSGWGGKLRRIVIEDDTNPVNWTGDSVLFDPGQPITAAPTVAMDDRGKKWVYAGTGRFLVSKDEENTDLQSYYGLIEPFTETDIDGDGNVDYNGYLDDSESLDWTEIGSKSDDLLDVTDTKVYDPYEVGNTNVDIDGDNTKDHTWDELVEIIDETDTDMDDDSTLDTNNGWYIDFEVFTDSSERNIGQATLLGDLLTFTTYMPSGDICSFGGSSDLFAVYYKTGTAYYQEVFGSQGDLILRDFDKDTDNSVDDNFSGLMITPNLHIGEEEGSKAFLQTSEGEIEIIQQINPGKTKSGVHSWRELAE